MHSMELMVNSWRHGSAHFTARRWMGLPRRTAAPPPARGELACRAATSRYTFNKTEEARLEVSGHAYTICIIYTDDAHDDTAVRLYYILSVVLY